MEDKIKQIIGKILNIDLSNKELSQINMKELNSWDSLAHLKLIIALEDEFNIEIEPDEIQLMKNGAEKIKEIISKK